MAVDGRAVAFVGPTGGGKTSLALRLVAEGASFLTDDVLALEERGGALVGHPGAALAAVRPAERDAIPGAIWRELGAVLGESGKTYLELERENDAVPLGALYFLRSGATETIAPLPSPSPQLLLASTFVLGIRTPERLRNQLDVCARIAREVPSYWLTVGGGRSAQDLAGMVGEHLRGEAAPR